jgi:hypothetical protein
MTLPETLIAAAVMSLLLSAVALSFSLASSYFRSGLSDQTLQSGAQMALRLMTADIAATAPKLVAHGTGPEGLVLASPYDSGGQFEVSPDGGLLYQKWVCYYLDPSGQRLLRQEQPLSKPSTTPAPIPTVPTMIALNTPRVVATNVTSLLFTINGATVTVRLTLQDASQTELQVEDAARMRNIPQ